MLFIEKRDQDVFVDINVLYPNTARAKLETHYRFPLVSDKKKVRIG